MLCLFFFFKQKTAYEWRISDWSSDVCSSDLINDRKLPDKAIDVIDEVGAMQMLVAPSKRKKTITAKEIEAVIATMARIPPKSVSSDDKATLASLETDLKRVVFGQNTAIEVLSSAIKLSRAGLRDPEKPIGNYLFSGPDRKSTRLNSSH